jgi:hypothetical protein
VLPGTKYSVREIAAILTRRRWLVFLPLAAGLAAMTRADGAMTAFAAPIGGLLLGVTFAAALEYRYSGFSCEEDAARVLMLPVLGTVPIASERGRRFRAYRRAAVRVGELVVVLSAITFFVWELLS